MKCKGKITKVESRSCKTGAGVSFTMIDIHVLAVGERDEVKTYKGSFSVDYCKRYYTETCGVSGKDLIGRPCEAVIAQRSYVGKDGKDHVATFAKWVNLLDESGNPIFIKSESKETDLPF